MFAARLRRSLQVRPRETACSRRCGGAAVDVGALARLAAAAGELLLEERLTLLELNPVVARPDGAVALDALARR